MGALSDRTEPDTRPVIEEPQADEPRASRPRALRDRFGAFRERIRSKPGFSLAYRVAVGVIGGLVLIAGIAMIPYPGPGWLVVFAGLGILATEFHWAGRVNAFAKRHYRRWMDWLGRQNMIIKLAATTGTCLVVLTTLWLLGLFATIGGWFDLHWNWLASPLFRP